MFQGRRPNRSEPASQQPQRPPLKSAPATNTASQPSRYETAAAPRVPVSAGRDGGSSSSTTPTSPASEPTMPSSPAESLPSPVPGPRRVRARERIPAARNGNGASELLRPPVAENDGQPAAQGEFNLLDKEVVRNRELVRAIQSAQGRAQDQQAQTLAEAQAQVDKLREERKTLEDQLAKQREAVDKADLERKNVEAALAAASRDKKQLESRLEAALASADKTKKQLESRLEAALASADKDKKQLESRLRAELVNADEDKKQLQNRLEAAERDKKQLEARGLEGEADNTKLRDRLAVVEGELQQERNRAANMREIIRALTQERDELIGDVDWLEEQIQERDVVGKEKDKVIQEWKGRHDIMKAGMGAPGKMLAEMAKQLMENNRLLEAMTSGYKPNGQSAHSGKQPFYK